MAQELKVKITNAQEVENKLKTLGATFVEESYFVDTYFNQPEGDVFKITETDKGFFLISLKAVEEKFTVIKNQKLDNVDAVRAEMTSEYGVKSTLKGKRKLFTLGDLSITISLIDGIGAFLIVTGENPTEDIITSKLGIQNPEYIHVSFDTLPKSDFKLPAE